MILAQYRASTQCGREAAYSYPALTLLRLKSGKESEKSRVPDTAGPGKAPGILDVNIMAAAKLIIIVIFKLPNL